MQTFEEHVKTVEPDQRFEYIVRDILRDKESRWSHNYYANPTSQWHAKVIKHATSVRSMQEVINKNLKVLAELDLQIKKSKLDPKNPEYQPLKKGEFEKIDASFTELAKANIYLADDIKAEQKDLDKYSYLDYIYSRTNKNMYALRNRFQIDGNLDNLRKGITFTFLQQYADLNMPLPELPKPSFSCW
jgi:DNA-directed RNA polymerase beta' subunit